MLYELRGISKTFHTSRKRVDALYEIDLDIDSGEFVLLKGHSGSGKSTLLMILGALLRPSTGTVRMNGRDLYAESQMKRAELRSREIGFIFQMFHLVPYLSVVDNVLMGDVARRHSKRGAEEFLDRLGLGARIDHRPSELSAGEMQRTAIARALLAKPSILLADEPTGNLDPKTAADVFAVLEEFRSEGGTVVVATHGSDADHLASRTVQLSGGRMLVEHEV